jgi:Zn-dependent protease
MYLRFACYLLVGLLIGMALREYARAFVATRLHDPTPRLWGRLTLHPRTWFDPFGSGLLPGLILVLWALNASFLPPPVAYGKPAPVDPNYFRRGDRDVVYVSLAGPLLNLVLGVAAGLAIRAGLTSEGARLVIGFMLANFSLAFFHLTPIPGLDGARIVGLLLPPRAREVYRNADQYLPLFALVLLFVFAGPLLSIIYSLSNATCSFASGTPCLPLP